MWQSKCFCSQSRLRLGWFHSNSCLWRRNKSGEDVASFLSEWLWRQVLHRKYTKTEGSWQCFVRAGNDKLEKKGLKARRQRRKNAKKVRIIREEIYCAYSKAVTPFFLLKESNTVLIKEVNHFSRALTCGVIAFSEAPNKVVIKNFTCQGNRVSRQFVK